MVYNEVIEIPARTETRSHNIAPCIKCGESDLSLGIDNNADQTKILSFISCRSKACDNNIATEGSMVDTIHEWNLKNDISKMIEARYNKIRSLKTEIEKNRSEVADLKYLLFIKTKKQRNDEK